jgi:hypothetical protein
VRRVMLDRYGWARYVADCGAQVVEKVPTNHALVPARDVHQTRVAIHSMMSSARQPTDLGLS